MAPKARRRAPDENSPSKNPQPPRTRSTSPSQQVCLHQSPKPKRKPRPKSIPAPTPDEVSAQIAARIAQLTAPPTTTPTAPKVKSNAVLNSTKIARLTTKIARNELEVARLEKEYANAKAALEHEEKIQEASKLSLILKERCDALVKKVESGEMTEQEVLKERDAIIAEMLPVSQALTTLSKVPGFPVTPALQKFAEMNLKDKVSLKEEVD